MIAPEAHEVSSETVARWSAERIGPTIIAASQRGGSWLECDNEAAQGDDKAERRVQESVKTRECRVASDLEEADRAEVTNSAKCEDRTKCPHAELEEPGSCPLPGQDVRSQGHDHCCCGQKHRDDERGRAAWAKRRYAIDFRDRGLRPPATAERPVDMKGGEQEEQQNERACHDCGHGNHSASEPLSSRAAVADAVFTSIGRATIALAVNISPALHAPVKYLFHSVSLVVASILPTLHCGTTGPGRDQADVRGILIPTTTW